MIARSYPIPPDFPPTLWWGEPPVGSWRLFNIWATMRGNECWFFGHDLDDEGYCRYCGEHEINVVDIGM
jgi:hypothetical protein